MRSTGHAGTIRSEAPPITVVVPTWRRASWLDRCLGGIGGQDPTPSCIVVVGRAEDVDARAVAETWRRRGCPVRWVEVDRPGHVAPVRRGLEEVETALVVFVDDDVVPRAGWLRALSDPFGDPRVACVGGRIETPELRAIVHPDAGQVRWYGQYVGNVVVIDSGDPRDVISVAEANWAWRTDVLRMLEFDRRLDFDDAAMYGLDLTLQARKLGWRIVYTPNARVQNESAPRDPSLDRADRVARTFAYSRNYTIIASRRLPTWQLPIFWLWWTLVGERGSHGVMTAVIDLPRGRTSRAMVAASFRGKWEGARQLLRGLTS